jgi:DNA-binding MurR/RpiR family transcriptional regulator
MSPLQTPILEGIKHILDQACLQDKQVEKHKKVVSSLVELFRSLGFKTFKEYRIKLKSKLRTSNRFGKQRQREWGLIDFYAKEGTQNVKIAVEYDNTALIKWKSIEKLLQSDAHYCFALVYGPKKETEHLRYFKNNLIRVQQVYAERISQCNETIEFDKLHDLTKKKFWFGIACKGVLNEIDLKNLLRL